VIHQVCTPLIGTASGVCVTFTECSYSSDMVPTPDLHKRPLHTRRSDVGRQQLGGMLSTRRTRLAGLCIAVTTGLAGVAASAALWPSAVSAAPLPAVFQSAGGGSLQTGPPVNIVAGGGGAAIGTPTITLIDGQTTAGDGWTAGDTISLELTSDPAGANAICDATLTAPTVTATTNTATPYTGITVAATTTSTCGSQKNAQTLTLPTAPSDENATVISLAGIRVTPGSVVSNGAAMYLAAIASSGTPFGSGSANAVAWVATIQTATTKVAKVVGAPASTLAAPVGDITVTDVTGGTINSSLVFTLSGGDTFAAPGKMTGPTGVVVAGPTETPPSSTLTFAVAGTSPADGTYTLTGATVNFGSSPGAHNVTVTTTPSGTNTSNLVGGATLFAATTSVQRVAGVDRYATATALFANEFADPTRAHAAVVTSGANFPDALSANLLASELGTGVMLTDPSSLSPSVALELASDDIDNVYLVGGTAAISANVATQIAAIHVLGVGTNPAIVVSRFAGADRFATNNLIDETAATGLGSSATAKTFNTAIIATGSSFADALAVGPIVYAADIPLVLTSPTSLSPSALQTLKDLQVKNVIIVGGTAAVSQAVETAITAAGFTVEYRIAGTDRTATAAQIAKWALNGLPLTPTYQPLASVPGWLTSSATAWIARGDNFADALAAGPVAGGLDESIVLTANPTTLGPGITAYFAGQAGTITDLVVLGGSSAVSPALLNSAITALGAPAP
jgi:putative cell wall-binding protein